MITHTKSSILAAKKLKALRVLKRYTIHEIAQQLNKSDQQLFRYEHGVNKIDLDTIINYLNVLNIDLTIFFSELQSEISLRKESNEDKYSKQYIHQENIIPVA